MRGPPSSYRPAVQPSGLCSLTDVWLVWNPSIFFRRHSSEPIPFGQVFISSDDLWIPQYKPAVFEQLMMRDVTLQVTLLTMLNEECCKQMEKTFAGAVSALKGVSITVSLNSHTTSPLCRTSFPLFAEPVSSLFDSLCEVWQTDETCSSQKICTASGWWISRLQMQNQ